MLLSPTGWPAKAPYPAALVCVVVGSPKSTAFVGNQTAIGILGLAAAPEQRIVGDRLLAGSMVLKSRLR